MKTQKFRKLEVWKKAMDLIESVYKSTDCFPSKEIYGLTSQLRRASLSVALNIAEGSGSDSDAEFGRYLGIALKSTYEVMCAIEISQKLGYINEGNANSLFDKCEEVSAMLSGFIKKLKSCQAESRQLKAEG